MKVGEPRFAVFVGCVSTVFESRVAGLFVYMILGLDFGLVLGFGA